MDRQYALLVCCTALLASCRVERDLRDQARSFRETLGTIVHREAAVGSTGALPAFFAGELAQAKQIPSVVTALGVEARRASGLETTLGSMFEHRERPNVAAVVDTLTRSNTYLNVRRRPTHAWDSLLRIWVGEQQIELPRGIKL